VFICGDTGLNSGLINGFYEPTQEKGLDGRVLYAKKSVPVISIEHYAGRWKIAPKGLKGFAGFVAHVEGGCGLDACTSREWLAFNGEDWTRPVDLKFFAGAEAERQVRGGCLRARQHAHPP
jgi:hypothetical protein